MALSEKHRSSIYRNLTELLGEEEAAALLSQFPTRDLDEPVTKEFVRAELAVLRGEIHELRGELHSEVSGLRGELHSEVAGLRGELHTGLAGVRVEIAGLEARMNERFRQQTMWMAGTMLTGISVAAAVSALVS